MVRWSSLLTMLLGTLALVSNVVPLGALGTWFGEMPALRGSLGVALVFLGAALRMIGRWPRADLRAIFGCAMSLVPLGIASIMLGEMAAHWNQIIPDALVRRAAAPSPLAHLTPAITLALVSLSLAVPLATMRPVWSRRLAQGLILTSMLLSALPIIGYAYGVQAVYRIGLFSSAALPTAAALFVCSLGLLHARPDFGVMTPLRSQGLGGLFARRALPFMVVIPLALGWLRIHDERLGYWSLEFGVAVHATATIVLFMIMVWWSAQSLDRADQRHEQTRKEASDLRRLSHLDPLTGVFNRRSLHERLDREWSKAIRHGHPLACIMLDIDHFKRINDVHGHHAGDAVLRTVAAMLVKQCRPGDLVCRFGGEEFCIIAPQTTEAGAAELAERLRAMFASVPIPIGGRSETITTSCGIAEAWGWADDSDAMIRRADRALLAAKTRGRNRVVMSSVLSEEDDRELAGAATR